MNDDKIIRPRRPQGGATRTGCLLECVIRRTRAHKPVNETAEFRPHFDSDDDAERKTATDHNKFAGAERLLGKIAGPVRLSVGTAADLSNVGARPRTRQRRVAVAAERTKPDAWIAGRTTWHQPIAVCDRNSCD
jgi:hypothetical protein